LTSFNGEPVGWRDLVEPLEPLLIRMAVVARCAEDSPDIGGCGEICRYDGFAMLERTD
jgi:hypothetical protein